RVDVEADRHRTGIDAQIAGEAAQRFGQRDRGAAVQQAERLLRACIDRHRAAQPVVADLGHADAEVLDHAAPAGRVDGGEFGSLLPDRHAGYSGSGVPILGDARGEGRRRPAVARTGTAVQPARRTIAHLSGERVPLAHTVTLQASGKRFRVEAGESVLEAARRARLALPYSCLAGV